MAHLMQFNCLRGRPTLPLATAAVLAALAPMIALAVTPTTDELGDARRWASASLISDGPSVEPPFSFTFGGKPSPEFLRQWQRSHTSRKLDDARTEHVLTFTQPGGGLAVRCIAIEYADFPAVEWTVYFQNNGPAASPILENIQALDGRWQRGGEGEFRLHHAVGSPATKSDYAPLETPLPVGASHRIAAAGGRPTNTDLCYFNLEWPGQGVIFAVGWPGQWLAEFDRDQKVGIRVRAGQELTHFKLLPGEEVRTPLVALLFWRGDWIRAQNLWRRWMIAHNLPRPGGKLPPPQFVASSSRAYGEMIGANEQNQIMHIDRYVEEHLKLDYWWMDAGWYVQQQGWPQVGTWEVDPRRFPHGLRPISDHAHAAGNQDSRLVRAGAGHARHLALRKSSGMVACGGAAARRWPPFLGNKGAWRRSECGLQQVGANAPPGQYRVDAGTALAPSGPTGAIQRGPLHRSRGG